MSGPEAAPAPAAPDGGEPGRRRVFGLGGLVRDLLALDRSALAILVAVPVALTLLDYYGMPWQYGEVRTRRPMHATWVMRTADPPLAHTLRDIEMPGPRLVRPFTWWGLWCVLLLVLLPMLVAWVFAKRSPRDLGLRLRGTGHDAWTYLALFALVFPIIYGISLTRDFQDTYPYYKPPSLDQGTLGYDFLVFQVVYGTQLFAIEFFFRGFMVLGLKRSLGWASVLVMLAPYCMIHYYKPMPEAMGAVAGGLILGALAWRTGTIVYGWVLHYAVALSMDLLALEHRGLI